VALVVLKFVSIALTGVFGIMGLLTTYKVEGRVTAWGRVALFGIVISAIVAAATQALEQHRAQQASRAEMLAVRTQLHEIARTLDPFETISLGFAFEIPNNDPAWAAYRARVQRMAQSLMNSGEDIRATDFGFSSTFTGPEGLEELTIRADAPAFPQETSGEALPYWIVQSADNIEFAALRHGQEGDVFSDSSLLASFFGETDIQLVYGVRDGSLRIESSWNHAPDVVEARSIRSNLDLTGAKVGLRFSGWNYDTLQGESVREQIREGQQRLRLTKLAVELSHGRTIRLTDFEPTRRANVEEVVFESVLPTNFIVQ
jgi:hypothetical protein